MVCGDLIVLVVGVEPVPVFSANEADRQAKYIYTHVYIICILGGAHPVATPE